MTYLYPQASLAVFCKAPIPGQVKTRLIPDMTEQEAADVHMLLTNRLLSWLDKAQLCPITLWCSPDTSHPFFQACAAKYCMSLEEQKGTDLGDKMQYTIARHLKSSSQALLIGCDSPSVRQCDVSNMIERLQSNDDVVLAPAEDGGYVMIGCRKDYPILFSDMEWGIDNVSDKTRLRAIESGIRLSSLRIHWDVDNYSDWQRFCALE